MSLKRVAGTVVICCSTVVAIGGALSTLPQFGMPLPWQTESAAVHKQVVGSRLAFYNELAQQDYAQLLSNRSLQKSYEDANLPIPDYLKSDEQTIHGLLQEHYDEMKRYRIEYEQLDKE